MKKKRKNQKQLKKKQNLSLDNDNITGWATQTGTHHCDTGSIDSGSNHCHSFDSGNF
jgi:hypothetical protein